MDNGAVLIYETKKEGETRCSSYHKHLKDLENRVLVIIIFYLKITKAWVSKIRVYSSVYITATKPIRHNA